MRLKSLLITLITLPLFIFSVYAAAEGESQSDDIKPVQVRIIRDSQIMAQVGNDIINVGNLNKDQEIMVYPLSPNYYEFTFGNAHGLIPKDAVLPLSKSKKALGLALADLQKLNQNLITIRPTTVYDQPKDTSKVFGVLNDNLRYPILGRLKDEDGLLWYEINIGDDAKYIQADECELDNGVPVLTYHHILQDSENKYFRHTSTTTSVTAFDNQMAYLKEADYQTISLYQLEGYLNNTVNIPARAVVLTFDDGLKSVHRYAYPILKKYDLQATAFIISSRIKHNPQTWDPNSLQFMSISELKQIQDVFDIQSHTHFLHRYSDDKRPVLLSRDEHNIELDFERSRRALTQFNPRVQYISYPFGGYNDNAIQAAKLGGYHLAVTTVRGKVKPGDNPFTLKRLYILNSDSIQAMAERIANTRSDIKPMVPKQ
ncbi:polysaccharide deacetylase family protein [Limnobaculum parvum]|uniref:Polysaccharide deacetylase family protein n=1 Tax=Limnobaculum parvum TaxID=2172103 RepID=A0A2Y9U190_9GAMM|nr:polysaccharide deacetylase family protein [Limnobaculum parvum]AWH89582.1 polysaccharide deacetylase family protein [Limnobaculum parvum]